MRAPYELQLALRYMRFHRGRTFLSLITLISVAGVGVGTAALVIALSMQAGFMQDVRDRIYSGSAHLTVLSTEQPGGFGGAGGLVARLQQVPGVRAASPVLYSPALLTFEQLGSHGFAELHGIRAVPHAGVILGQDAADSAFPALDRSTESGRPGILLGDELAQDLGAIEGELIRVLVPEMTLAPWGAMPRSRLYEVVGTYHSDHFQEDAVRAYLQIDEMRSLLRAGARSSWIEIGLDDLRQLPTMKQRLGEAAGAGWVVVDLIEQNRDILRALRSEKLLLFLAIGLIVVVASLNIVSTLVLMVSDKLRDIGTLTAMGARPAGVARVFMLQGTVIGVTGSMGGLLLGTVACWVLDRYEVIRLNPEVYYLKHLPFAIQPLDLAVVGIAALVISFLATLYPAFKAARLDPLEALRYE